MNGLAHVIVPEKETALVAPLLSNSILTWEDSPGFNMSLAEPSTSTLVALSSFPSDMMFRIPPKELPSSSVKETNSSRSVPSGSPSFNVTTNGTLPEAVSPDAISPNSETLPVESMTTFAFDDIICPMTPVASSEP